MTYFYFLGLVFTVVNSVLYTYSGLFLFKKSVAKCQAVDRALGLLLNHLLQGSNQGSKVRGDMCRVSSLDVASPLMRTRVVWSPEPPTALPPIHIALHTFLTPIHGDGYNGYIPTCVFLSHP